MGRMIEGQDKVRIWGETANTKGLLKSRMKTHYYRNFLTYINTWKELKWNYHIKGETMSQLDILRYQVKSTVWGKVCVIVYAVGYSPRPDGEAGDQRAGGQLEASPLLTSAHGEKRYCAHTGGEKVRKGTVHTTGGEKSPPMSRMWTLWPAVGTCLQGIRYISGTKLWQ